MHDNARPHTARVTRQFLQRNGIETLQWPAMSPDMNPIEHLCDELGRRVRARGNAQLAATCCCVVGGWERLPNAVVLKYV